MHGAWKEGGCWDALGEKFQSIREPKQSMLTGRVLMALGGELVRFSAGFQHVVGRGGCGAVHPEVVGSGCRAATTPGSAGVSPACSSDCAGIPRLAPASRRDAGAPTGFILSSISRRRWTRRYSPQRDEFRHPQIWDAPGAEGGGREKESDAKKFALRWRELDRNNACPSIEGGVAKW